MAVVRPHEYAKMGFLLGLIVICWVGLTVAMTVSEALLLTHLGIRYLPVAMLLTATLTVVGSLAYASQLARRSSVWILAATLGLNGALLILSTWGLHRGALWLGLPLFALYGSSFTLLSAQCFGLAGECIDSHSSKRLFPVLAVACTCGELLGGILVASGSTRISPSGWLLVWTTTQGLAMAWLLLHQKPLQQWRQAVVGAAVGKHQIGLSQAISYLRTAPMARALAFLLATMVLCQGASQYLFSNVFAVEFSDAQGLTRFLGQLVTLSNLVKLVVAFWITPRIVAHLGVARASWIHPGVMVASLAFLSIHFSLGAAICLWLSRRTLQDCLGTPVRNLLFNAIPGRLRPWLRAFLDGVVVSSSQATIGLGLLLAQPFLRPQQMVYFGLILGVLYVLASWRASRHYLKTLVKDLQQGRLRLTPIQTRVELVETTTSKGYKSGLEDPDPQVRLATLQGFRPNQDPLAYEWLAARLGDSTRLVRQQAIQTLAYQGEAAIGSAQAYLTSDQPVTVEASIACLGQIGGPWANSILRQQLHTRVVAACRAWLSAYYWEPRSQQEDRFFLQCLDNLRQTSQRLAFRILFWLEGQELVESLRLALTTGSLSTRANALEILSNLGDRSLAQLLVWLLEPNQDKERARLLDGQLKLSREREAILGWASHCADPWVRWGALAIATPRESTRIQHLLAFKACSLFQEVSLDILDRLHQQLCERRFAAGTTLWERGQPIEASLLLVSGQVDEPGKVHGLVELFSPSPQARTTLVTVTPCRFLALEGKHWRDLVAELPELGIALFAWMSRELRRVEQP